VNNEKEISNDQDIAEHFNNYFINAPRILTENIKQPTINISCMNKLYKNSIFLEPPTEDEVLKILSSFKNSSPGYDDINIKVLKAVKDVIISPLTHICKILLDTGIFPDQCKIAKVVPIFKKGEANKVCNYRPVSVLPAISKILERLMYNRLIKFIDHFNIIKSNQFGFRKNYSTSLAINSFVDHFHKTIEKDQYMISLFIDLSRAFDTISHEILFNKLYIYGIRGLALDWIKNYLQNRKQFVIYKNAKSSLRNNLMGVPQGSILGPLLFILYVNDLPNVSSKLTFTQYADDTSI